LHKRSILENIDENTVIIFGGSLYAVGINGFTEFKNKPETIIKN